MGKEDYRNCVGAGLKGKTLGKEERKLEFCIISKLCSQKAKDREEAKKLCAEAALNPTPNKGRKSKKCKIDTGALAGCIIKALGDSEINLAILATAIADCTGQKAEKPPTRERFIKKCFKENVITGDIRESQKLRSMCNARWKEQEVAPL